MNKIAVLVSALILMTSMTNFCVAQVLLPETYEGFAYIDGVIAENQTPLMIKSHSTGQIVGRGKVFNDKGEYVVDLIFDNDFAEGDEGADSGEIVDWYIMEYLAYQPKPGSDKAEPGEVTLNYDIYANSVQPASTQTTEASQCKYSKTSVWLLRLVQILAFILAFLFFEALFTFLRRKTRK